MPPFARASAWPNPNGRVGSVSDSQLIAVTDAADSALGAFDFEAHGGKGVRVYVQGFG